MTKLEDMWAALVAYQPQADAGKHGESWAKMCSAKTADVDAAYAAYADAYAVAAGNDADAAVYAARAAIYAAYAAVDAYHAAFYDAYADAFYIAAAGGSDANAKKWAQKAVDMINKVLVKQALAQPEQEQGRHSAFKEIAEKVKEMPWENDTKDSFIVWLKEQR